MNHLPFTIKNYLPFIYLVAVQRMSGGRIGGEKIKNSVSDS